VIDDLDVTSALALLAKNQNFVRPILNNRWDDACSFGTHAFKVWLNKHEFLEVLYTELLVDDIPLLKLAWRAKAGSSVGMIVVWEIENGSG
jgi:hypothetical protein